MSDCSFTQRLKEKIHRRIVLTALFDCYMAGATQHCCRLGASSLCLTASFSYWIFLLILFQVVKFTATFHYLLLITLLILSYVVYFIATYPYLLLTILLILFLVVYFTAIDSGLGDVFHGHLSLPSDQSTDSVLGGVFHGPFPLPTADHLTDSVIIMWCISSSPFPTFYWPFYWFCFRWCISRPLILF